MADGQAGVHEIMLTAEDEMNAFHERSASDFALGLEDGDEHALGAWSGRHQFVDDLTSLRLSPDIFKAPRPKELEHFRTRQVWDVRSINDARRRMGRAPISVRWVETNKGEDRSPNIRSGLVAEEIRTTGRDSIFSPTPPLEFLRMILTMETTSFGEDWKPVRKPHNVVRAQVLPIFNARTNNEDQIYVQFPAEAGRGPEECGLLCRHTYGTRRAAEGWLDEYSGTLVSEGFLRGKASVCVFVHPVTEIAMSVHGDDFTATGPKSQLDCFQQMMQGHHKLTVDGRLRPGASANKEATVFNRVMQWTEHGIEYEADPGHAERLLDEIEISGEGVRGVVTTGQQL